MIAKAIHGADVSGLVRYLYSETTDELTNNPHDNPRVIAGWASRQSLEPPLRVGAAGAQSRDFRPLIDNLNAPVAALRTAPRQPVYHVPIRLHPSDPVLSDAQWARVSEGMVHALGLGGPGGARWVAIRHGDEHVHLVITLARQDAGRADLWNDHFKLRGYCRAQEKALGLVATGPADRTAARAPTKAEMQRAVRAGLVAGADHRATSVTVSAQLRRMVQEAAAGATSTTEFFHRLQASGAEVELRMSTKNEGQVTGYKVRLPDYHAAGDPGLWFAGGRLAPDLSLPKLQARWDPGPAQPPTAAAADPPSRVQALAELSRATRESARHITDPAMPRSAAEALHLAARALESTEAGPLTEAARRFDRSYREPGGASPAAGRHAADLRSAAGALGQAGQFSAGQDHAPVVELLEGITTLLQATAQLREGQQREVQAQAARQAAGVLRDEVTRLRALDPPPSAGAELEHARPPAPDAQSAASYLEAAREASAPASGPARSGEVPSTAHQGEAAHLAPKPSGDLAPVDPKTWCSAAELEAAAARIEENLRDRLYGYDIGLMFDRLNAPQLLPDAAWEKANRADRLAAETKRGEARHHREQADRQGDTRSDLVAAATADYLAARGEARTVDAGAGFRGRNADRVQAAGQHREEIARRWLTTPEQLPGSGWKNEAVRRSATQAASRVIIERRSHHVREADRAEQAAAAYEASVVTRDSGQHAARSVRDREAALHARATEERTNLALRRHARDQAVATMSPEQVGAADQARNSALAAQARQFRASVRSSQQPHPPTPYRSPFPEQGQGLER